MTQPATGCRRATLRAFDEPANCYEDDKDHVKVQIYRDLKKEVDLHKDIPTASTCARTIFLPVFAKEEHFLQKLDTALRERTRNRSIRKSRPSPARHTVR